MKERPILFNGEMVRAILDGSKTQTRRAFSDRVIKTLRCASAIGEISDIIGNGVLGKNDINYIKEYCPYGQPGDRLWVRETWGICPDYNQVRYKADKGMDSEAVGGKWHPSIHMFREYSRINLEITNIGVERLNDISEEDAKKEGVKPFFGRGTDPNDRFPYLDCFMALWESINGKGSWDKNPWVWVVEFRRVL